MATSGPLKDPALTETTIMLPRKEMTHPLDANKEASIEHVASMEVDGFDPSDSDVSSFAYASIQKETTSPRKVGEVKDLQSVYKSRLMTVPQLDRVKAWRCKCLLFTTKLHTDHHNSGR